MSNVGAKNYSSNSSCKRRFIEQWRGIALMAHIPVWASSGNAANNRAALEYDLSLLPPAHTGAGKGCADLAGSVPRRADPVLVSRERNASANAASRGPLDCPSSGCWRRLHGMLQRGGTLAVRTERGSGMQTGGDAGYLCIPVRKGCTLDPKDSVAVGSCSHGLHSSIHRPEFGGLRQQTSLWTSTWAADPPRAADRRVPQRQRPALRIDPGKR